jgi:hypothetical protein
MGGEYSVLGKWKCNGKEGKVTDLFILSFLDCMFERGSSVGDEWVEKVLGL